ncbi:phage tail tape measure protein [Streptomyces sp. C-3]
MAEFQIGSAFVRIGAQLDSGQVNQQTGAMGGQLAAWAGGLGLGAIISKGIADGLNIQAANTKLAAQMGLTTGEAKKAGDAAGSVYRDGFGASIEDVNGAIKGVGQNMVDLKTTSKPQLEALSKGALGISEAFDVDVNESTRAAGALMKNGLAKDGQQALDIITKGFQSGMDVSGDWLDTLNEYSPHFAKIGIDGPDALNLINQFMKAGVRDTDAAADAIKEFGLRAIDTADSTTDAYKGLGLNADDMRKKIAGGGPAGAKAMQQVFDALQKVKDPVKQNQLGTALMGTQWEDTVRTILPEIDLTKSSIGDVAGATDKMNKRLHDTPQAKLEQIKREAEGLLAQVTQLPGPLGVVGAAMVSFGPQLLTMGAGLAIIGPSLAPAIAATWAWTAALLANPVTWIVIGIIALVAAIVLIATKTTWFQQIWSTVWGAIKTATKATWDWIKNAIGTAIDWLKTLFLNFTGPGLIIKHWDTIKNATGEAWDWVKGKVSGAVNGAKAVVSSVTDAVEAKVSSVWGGVKSSTSGAWNWVKSKVTGGVTGAKTAVSNAVDGVRSKISSGWSTVKSSTSDTWNWIRSKISGGIDSARDAVFNAVGRIGSTVSGIKSKVMNALSGAATWLRESGRKIIQGLIDGIKGMAGNVKDAVKGVLSDARNLLPFSPAKEGPFSGRGWTLYSGRSIMSGLSEGITDEAPSVKKSLASALGAAHGETQLQAAVPSAVAPTAPTTSYGDIYVTINARDLAEVKSIHDLFTKLQQTARAGQNKRALMVAR